MPGGPKRPECDSHPATKESPRFPNVTQKLRCDKGLVKPALRVRGPFQHLAGPLVDALAAGLGGDADSGVNLWPNAKHQLS